MKTNKLFLILTILVVSVITTLTAQNSTEELKGLLGQIKTYDYGQSRENLTAFNDLLRVMGNSDEQQVKAEEQMIDFLKSDATLAAKQFICECLSIYGSDESVSVLEEMLTESATENMALFALERIATEDASEVLLDAFSESNGDLKVGIINALGNRRVKEALDEISPLILDSDSKIAYAAIAATGKIGGDAATETLTKALSDPNIKLKAEVIQAILKCATDYEENRDNKKALTIYQSLNKSMYDHQVRHAALRGIIRTSGQKATDVIVAFFDNENPDNYSIVIPLVREIPDSEDVTPIVDHLLKMKPADQVILLGILAGRKDPVVVKAMEKLSKSSNDQVRIASLTALSQSGDAKIVLLFVGIAVGTEGLDRSTARMGLDLLNAPGTDELIVKTIPVSDDLRKIELIRCTSSRNITSASSLLVGELQSSNAEVRIASIKALKNLGSSDQLDTLIGYQMKTKNDQELKELENTIVAISNRIPEPQSQAGFLLANMGKLDNDKMKASYLEMMGRIGDPKSLVVLETALKGKNDDLKTSAIRGLSNWPDSTPANELLSIAKSSTNQIHQTLAIRGYLNLLDQDNTIDNKDKVNMYTEAMTLAKGAPEKRLVLSGIAKVNTPEAFKFATSYLGDQDVNDEAESAVLRIAWRLGADNIDLTLPVIKKVNSQTQNEEIKEQSGNLINSVEGGGEEE
jgi:HEAT repeat protein